MTSRVLIFDIHPAIRTNVRAALQGDPKWEVCAEAETGEQALQQIAQLIPDIVILDVSLPVIHGFELVQQIRRVSPATKIVLFSVGYVPSAARDIGVDAFVAKSSGTEVLAATLESVRRTPMATGAA